MVDRALMDNVCYQRGLFDGNVRSVEGRGRSDHFLVDARLKVVGVWRSDGRMKR